jgi:hypothetical protein
MAMAIVRHFDRLHSTLNTADVAAAGQLLEPIFAELGRFAELGGYGTSAYDILRPE